MRVVAGVDVGNSTTEVVLVDASVTPPRPLVWERVPTRGRKGSAAASTAAAAVVRRLAGRAGVTVERVVVAPQQPVDSHALVVPAAAPSTGRLRLLAAGRSTPAGQGVAVGVPVRAEDEPRDGAVVLVARDPLGYRSTVERVEAWLAGGARVVGVLLAGDEAVLVSSRLAVDVPVADQVDVEAALACDLVAVEVSPGGLRELVDPVRVAALLGLGPDEHAAAEAVASRLRGLRDGVIGVSATALVEAPTADVAWAVGVDGARVTLTELASAARPVHELALPGRGGTRVAAVSDVWAVDLDAVQAAAAVRRASVHGTAIAVASLAALPESASDPVVSRASTDGGNDNNASSVGGDEPARALAAALGVPVARVSSETLAGRVGALTTPAARPGALVVDLGGGTVDVAPADGDHRAVAGAGELLTAAVAHVLDVPKGAAEWVKREPSSRLEGPHVLVGEDGERCFVDAPVASDAVGSLVVPGPAGWLPFHRRLAPGEWRMLRQHLKRAVVGANVARAAAGLDTATDVILVGGPAGDAELLDHVVRALPGAVPGRADVAGILGHRWAVAYGLCVLDADGRSTVVA